jgi:hypothetical protein
VAPEIFALMCSVADALSPSATVDGNKIKAASLPASAIAPNALSHTHLPAVSQSWPNWTALNWGSASPGTLQTVCSDCSDGAAATGGSCWIDGMGCSGNGSVWLRQSYLQGKGYCCTAVAASGGVCNLHAQAACLSIGTSL